MEVAPASTNYIVNTEKCSVRESFVCHYGTHGGASWRLSNERWYSCSVLQETRTLAEIAKAELDGTVLNNRPIRIRFATHGAALSVRNLLPAVTNELLEKVCTTSHSTRCVCIRA